MTRAGVYGRNSKGDGASIEDQLDLGCKTCAAQGWTLAGKYSDDSSASRYRSKDRDDWTRLLADLAAGHLDVLVLWKSARGSRDAIEWLNMLDGCRQRGTLIHVMADHHTYDPRNVDRDWEALATDGIKSASYSDYLSRDVRRGTLAAAAEGRPHGRVTYGYERTYSPGTGKMTGQRPGPNAAIVQEIFEKIAAHTPINAIERDLRQRRLPSPTGVQWRRTTIRNMVTNVAYIGLRRHVIRDKDTGSVVSDQVHPAPWPPLVDEARFYDVQALLGDKDRKTTRPGAARHLLSYIATAPCGGTMQGQDSRRRTGQDRYGCGRDGCVSVCRNDADRVVQAFILARVRQCGPSLLADPGDPSALAEAGRLRAQLEAARRSHARPDGLGISTESLAMTERALIPAIADADRRGRPVRASGALGELVGADDVTAVWAGLDMAARREVVRTLADVRVGPTTRTGRIGRGEDRLMRAAARLGGSTWAGSPTPWSELGGFPAVAQGVA